MKVIQSKLSFRPLLEATSSSYDHFCDQNFVFKSSRKRPLPWATATTFGITQNPLFLSPYKRALRLGAEEIGQIVVKELVQDKLIKKYVKLHGNVKQQKLHWNLILIKADRDLLIISCGSRRTWAIHLDEHLEKELFPISLSIATPNGSLRKPSARYCKRMTFRASPLSPR